MNLFPRLETERLILSELQTTDIHQIVMYASNKKVSEFTVNIPFPYSEKDATYWINSAYQGFNNRTQFIFAIRLKGLNDFIGGIGVTVTPQNLRAEIGYWLAEPFWNKGLMTEATGATISFSFTSLGVNKITATHFEINTSSGKVMTKCGMHKEGVLKEHIFKNSVFHNLVVYGLTKTDYELQHLKSLIR